MIKVRCPICDRLLDGEDRAQWPDLPFCSARCRLIDLGRWLGGNYRIAAESEEDAPAEYDSENGTP